MRTVKKLLFIALGTIFLVSTILFAAACEKQTVKLTFETNGGTQIEAIEAEVGEDISSRIPSNPTKDGFEFNGWYLDSALKQATTLPTTMPEKDTTFYAKWKNTTVDYTVEIYLADLSGQYILSEEDTVTGQDSIGKELTVKGPSIKGFTLNSSHVGNISQRTLSQTASENIFKLYYDRQVAVLNYDENAPAGIPVQGEMGSVITVYGATITVAEPTFSAKGCRFAGWSKTENGSVDYHVGDTFTIEKKTVLYAVWNIGRIDRFGGSDIIYVLHEKENAVILERGGIDFEGTVQNDEFSFNLPDGKVMTGKLFGKVAFCYSDCLEELVGTYSNYNPYYDFYGDFDRETDRLRENYTLTVNEDLTATMKYNAKTFSGTIDYDSENDGYKFVSEQFSISLNTGVIENEAGEKIPVFAEHGRESGYYPEITISNGYITGVTGFNVNLDGYGNIQIFDSYNYTEPVVIAYGRYTFEQWLGAESGFHIIAQVSDPYHYFGNSDELTLRFGLLSQGEGNNYIIRPDYSAGTYKGTDGSTLVLDGYGLSPESAYVLNADGTRKCSSNYIIAQSAIYGMVITVKNLENGTVYGTYVINEDGAFTEYTEAKIPLGDYFYLIYSEETDEMEFADPNVLLVVYQDGSAEIYENSEKLTKLSSGTLVVREAGPELPLYEYYPEGKSKYAFVCMVSAVENESGIFNVFIILELNGKKDYNVLREDNGQTEIWINENLHYLFYFNANKTGIYANYTVQHEEAFGVDLYTITWTDSSQGQLTGFYAVFDRNEDGNGIFTRVERSRYYTTIGGEIKDVSVPGLVIDDKGNASLTRFDENGSPYYTAGKVVQTGESTLGDKVYEFVAEGKSLAKFVYGTANYIEGAVYTFNCIYSYDATTAGTFMAEGVTLILDGYRLGVYSDESVTVSGEYYLSENILCFDASNGNVYKFEFRDGKILPLDSAFGAYRLNLDEAMYSLKFDGRGHVECLEKDVEGTYSAVSDSKFEWILLIDLDGDGKEECYQVALSGEDCMIYSLKGVFIGELFEIIYLDGYGKITYYTAYGKEILEGEAVIDAERNRIEAHFGRGKILTFAYDAENNTFTIVD